MKIFSLLICILYSSSIFAWGQTGHRVSGAIATKYLSEEAKSEISKILPNESLAEASTWADEMRSNQDKYWQKTASSYHYVTVPKGEVYKKAPKRGDSVSALKKFRKVLLDKKASLEEKQLALRFTIHLIGDLHQPMHAGDGTDRGGNDRKLTFFWEESNLHRVWDSGMIDQKKLSYTEWTSWLDEKISPKQLTQWQETDPLVWIHESTKIRDKVYPESDSISYQYLYDHVPTMKLRLQQAGIRISAYLNEVYSK